MTDRLRFERLSPNPAAHSISMPHVAYHPVAMAALVFAIAFVLNAVWEVLQTPWYSGERQSLLKTFLDCLPAITMDALFTLALYAPLSRLRTHSFPQLTSLGFLLLGAMGGIAAVVVELVALSFGWWSYRASMPRVAGLGIGLLPVLQLAFLTPLTFLVARGLLKPTQPTRH